MHHTPPLLRSRAPAALKAIQSMDAQASWHGTGGFETNLPTLGEMTRMPALIGESGRRAPIGRHYAQAPLPVDLPHAAGRGFEARLDVMPMQRPLGTCRSNAPAGAGA